MSRSQRHLRVVQGVDSAGERYGVNQITRPTVAGTATNGSILTGTNGTYKGFNTNAITVTAQWLRNGVAIAGATLGTYTLAAADVGKRIQFQNTAVNNLATQRFQSLQTAVVV